MGFSVARSFALLGLLAGLPAVQAQPPFLVRDVNTAHPPLQQWDWSDEMESAGGKVFFVHDDGIHGKELWVSDSSASGPHLVRDILPGARSANPTSLTANSSGLLYFIADDGVHGRELWRSDGTVAGTALALDFNPLLADSVLSVSAAGGPWIFAVVDYEHSGLQLVFTDDDGAFSTQTIAPLDPGSFGPVARVLSDSSQQVLYAFNDGVHGVEPWVFTKAGFFTPLGDLNPGTGSSIVMNVPLHPPSGADAVAAPWGGFLFTADDGVHGRELWRTDGTAAGTHLVKDILPGMGSSYPLGLTALNGAVYFHASGPEGDELWRTDGTAAGTTLLKDIDPGSSGSNPLEITVVGNQLFFLAFSPTAGTPLWRSDGTAAGTVPLHSSEPINFCCSAPGFNVHGFSDAGGKLLFLAGTNIWRSDGTDAGTVRVADIGSSAAVPMEDGYAVAGGSLHLRGGTQGQEVWKSDGTAAGTLRILSGPSLTSSFFIENGTTYPRDGFAELNGAVCFAGYDGSAQSEIWKSDGTNAGTVKIDTSTNPEQLLSVNSRLVFLSFGNLRSTDGTPGGGQSLSATTQELTRTGGAVYFRLGSPGGINGEPWKTDGTPEGTGQFADIVPGSPSSDPRLFTAAAGKVFFQATDATGTELWVSDGTSAGTSQVADLEPGAASSTPQDLTAAGGLLFFTATSGSGRELWKSDGTLAGTVLVKDIQPGAVSSIPSSGIPGTFAAPAGGPLFFAADDGVNGETLWKSDGTDAGTVRVQNVPSGFQPRSLTVAGSRVFFVAYDLDHGRELWVSDGTDAGTHRVRDIAPGVDSALPYNLTAVGSVLVFSAFDPAHGVELWRSDGTAVGTRRVQDLAPGALSSSPLGLTAAGPNVYFAANDNTTGFELWAVPRTNVLATFEDVPTSYWAWRSVEAVATAGITLGCGEGLYCPERTLTRAEMGVFLGRSLHGSAFVPPPPTGTRFDDVPASYWAADWIEQIAADGLTQGCSASPPLYCPGSLVSRAEMAVFLLRSRHGGAYVPPPATGTRFADVPADYWAAPWIEQLATEGITNGCDVNLYCPARTVNRAEMAVFLGRAFNLPLP